MRKLLLGLGLWLALSAPALAQSNIGSILLQQRPQGSGGLSVQDIATYVLSQGGSGSPGGTSGQVQFNNAGLFGGLTNAQLTALCQQYTASLSGCVPLSGGGTTNFLRADGTWAVPPGTGGGGAVSSVTGGLGVTVSPTTGATVVSTPVTQRNNTATTDTLVTGDGGTVVTESNAAAVAVSLAQAGTTGFASGWYVTSKNLGAGTVTITPTASTIDGAASLTLTTNQSVDIYSNGTNYITLPGRGGSGVTAIASGAQALGTTAVASSACSSAITATATGVLTTDRITANFNADPTSITGYLPSTSGGLSIFIYPTANAVNFKYCNPTSASITPGAVTINWGVVR